MKSDGREPHLERRGGQGVSARRTVDWDKVRYACLPSNGDDAGEALAKLIMTISSHDDGAINPDARPE